MEFLENCKSWPITQCYLHWMAQSLRVVPSTAGAVESTHRGIGLAVDCKPYAPVQPQPVQPENPMQPERQWAPTRDCYCTCVCWRRVPSTCLDPESARSPEPAKLESNDALLSIPSCQSLQWILLYPRVQSKKRSGPKAPYLTAPETEIKTLWRVSITDAGLWRPLPFAKSPEVSHHLYQHRSPGKPAVVQIWVHRSGFGHWVLRHWCWLPWWPPESCSLLCWFLHII